MAVIAVFAALNLPYTLRSCCSNTRLLASPGICNMRMLCAVAPQVGQLVEQQGGQLSGMDVPALLHLYKARLAIACCNHKVAKKEVRLHIYSNHIAYLPSWLAVSRSAGACCCPAYAVLAVW
jgi:hypothetical protein